jgi:hypothetical protein
MSGEDDRDVAVQSFAFPPSLASPSSTGAATGFGAAGKRQKGAAETALRLGLLLGLLAQTATLRAGRFLRQPSRPSAPRPAAKSGSAAGIGVALTGVNST